ncbi:MAG: hypothetical protein FJY17_04925 [Bacteroidetes bacterium]|nr:hypothetical protein [Bacteroidota bacterium]
MPFTRKCGGFFRFSAWEFTSTCDKWKNLNEAKPRKGIAFARPTPWVHRLEGGIPGYFLHLHFDTSFGLLSVRGKTKNQGTGLLLGSETIHLIQFHTNRTISAPPDPLFCR